MPFFIFIIIAIAVVIYSLQSLGKAKEAWQYAARKLGLRFSPGSGFSIGIITGKCDGHKVTVDTITKGSGKNSQQYTRFKITYAKKVPFRFSLTKQRIYHSLGKVFGLEDLEIGSPSFDDNVIIKGRELGEIQGFLNPQKQRIIKSLILNYTDTEINERSIYGLVRGTVKESTQLLGHIKQLRNAANLLSPDKVPTISETKSVKEKIKMSIDGFTGSSLKSMKSPDNDSKEIINDVSETENLVTIPTLKPKVTETPKIKKVEVETVKEKFVDPSESSNEPTNSVSSESISIEEFCHSLFESKLRTSALKHKFEEDYKENVVCWQGTLLSAKEFSYDFVFKNCSGVKATFELMEVNTGFSTRKVKAVVHFPQGSLESLREKLNSSVAFSGKIIHLDTLSREAFLTEGKII